MAEAKTFYGTGRRKSSVARVYAKLGSGKITVNERDVKEYFPYETLVLDLKQPLTILGVEAKYDFVVFAQGGGFTGQAGAVRLGIARALLEAGEDRGALKAAGMLTRNPRAKERKKYGLKAARRAPQFSKR
ncbi:MAG: 30S ribosomal protein S9 [Bacilli bacterium]|nr:30S ribosomal protein S9 [Bacilli bacterium]